MRATRNVNEVNVFMVWVNINGEITDEVLIATFINENWARSFIKANNEANGDFNYLDMRIVGED